MSPMRIIVVGVCASGKTTLAESLRRAGYDADTVAQEHSYVPTLWQHSRPTVLVYLDASYAAIRKRRDVWWDEAYLEDERERLADARAHADLYVMTDKLNADQVFRRVRRFLEKQALKQRPPG